MPAISANPEVARGLKSLYAQLRDQTKQNEGELPAGFSKSFTSADGAVTFTLSTEGLGAYAGSRNDDGSLVQKDDVGIHLKEIVRAGGATSESNALSSAIHSVDDINADETRIEQNFWITDMGVVPAEEDDSAAAAGTETDLTQKLSNFSTSSEAIQSKQQSADSLIDALTSFLQSLKNETENALRDSSREKATGTPSPRPVSSSLLIRVDMTA